MRERSSDLLGRVAVELLAVKAADVIRLEYARVDAMRRILGVGDAMRPRDP